MISEQKVKLVLLPSTSPYYIQEGDILTLECVVNDKNCKRSDTVNFRKQNLYDFDIGHSESKSQNRFSLHLNVTFDTRGIYFCEYRRWPTLTKSSSIEVIVQGI